MVKSIHCLYTLKSFLSFSISNPCLAAHFWSLPGSHPKRTVFASVWIESPRGQRIKRVLVTGSSRTWDFQSDRQQKSPCLLNIALLWNIAHSTVKQSTSKTQRNLVVGDWHLVWSEVALQRSFLPGCHWSPPHWSKRLSPPRCPTGSPCNLGWRSLPHRVQSTSHRPNLGGFGKKKKLRFSVPTSMAWCYQGSRKNSHVASFCP